MRIVKYMEIFPPKDRALREAFFFTREYVDGLKAKGMLPSDVKRDLESHLQILRERAGYIAQKHGRTSIDIYRLTRAVLRDYALFDLSERSEAQREVLMI